MAFAASTVCFVWFTLWPWISHRDYLGDYLIFWRAGVGWPLYRDLHRLAFSYPPTTLLLLRPFALLPFWWSLAAWSLAGLAILATAARKLVNAEAVWLGLLTFSALMLLLSGQISCFVIAAIVGGVVSKKPWARGLCFAVAAAIKPQAVVAVPIALLARKDYRTIVWGSIFYAGFVAASVAFWGAPLWFDWFGSLDDFRALLVEREMDRADVGIAGLALKLGLPSWLFVLGVPLGIAAVWQTFRRHSTHAEQYASLVCGAVLLSPYVLGYDIAGLAMASVAFLLDEHQRPMIWRASAMVVSYALAAPGIVLLAGCLAVREGVSFRGSLRLHSSRSLSLNK